MKLSQKRRVLLNSNMPPLGDNNPAVHPKLAVATKTRVDTKIKSAAETSFFNFVYTRVLHL